MRPRPAPTAARIAISRFRPVARASSKLPTLTVSNWLERDSQRDGRLAVCIVDLMNPAHQELAALAPHLGPHRGANLLGDRGGVHLDQVGLGCEGGDAAAKQHELALKLYHPLRIVTFVVGVISVKFLLASLVFLRQQPLFLGLQPLQFGGIHHGTYLLTVLAHELG